MTAPAPASSTLTPPRVAPPSGGAAPPGAPPDGPPFQSALEESARTASAEGQQQSRQSLSGGRHAAAFSQPADAKASASSGARHARGESAFAGASFVRPGADSHTTAATPAGTAQSTPVPEPATSDSPATTPGPTIAGEQSAAALPLAAAGNASVTGLSGTTPAGTRTGTKLPAMAAAPTAVTPEPSATAADSIATPSAGMSSSAESGALPATANAHGEPTTAGAPELASPPSSTPVVASAPSTAPAAGTSNASSTSALPTPQPNTPTTGVPAPAAGAPGADASAARSAHPAAAPLAAAPSIPTPPRGASSATSARGLRLDVASDAPTAPAAPAAPGSPATPTGSMPALTQTVDPAAASSTPAASGTGQSVATPAVAPPPGDAAPLADSFAPAQPASAPSDDPTPASGYGVDLQQTIEAVHTTIELATRQGLSQARIALAPAELGEIRIHLSQSASGLVARLTADTSAGAQALNEGRAELRSSLSSLGLSAMHLDTSAFQSGAHGQAHQSAQRSLDPGLARRARTGEGEGGDTDSESDTDTTQLPDSPSGAPRSSRGALVDVLA